MGRNSRMTECSVLVRSAGDDMEIFGGVAGNLSVAEVESCESVLWRC